jgi:predicted Rossmann-fold nucleotide-binding protein
MGTDFWSPIGETLRHSLLGAGTISPEDVDIFTTTDDPGEAVDIIRRSLEAATD